MTKQTVNCSESEMINWGLSGFELYGKKNSKGKIKLHQGAVIDEFPEEITLGHNTYTLEYVETDKVGGLHAQYV